MKLNSVIVKKLEDNDPMLKILDFDHAILSEAELTSLFKALGSNHHVTDLSIVGNKFNEDTLTSLGEMLRSNQSITTLNLSKIVVEGTNQLISTILCPCIAIHNPSLIELALDGNDLGDDQISEILSAIPSTLKKLDLSGNNIMDAKALACFLKSNVSLAFLDLWDNQLGDEGAMDLLNALTENSTLEVLSVGRNGIADEILSRLQRLPTPLSAPSTTNMVQTNDINRDLLHDRIAQLETALAEQSKEISILHQRLEKHDLFFKQLGYLEMGPEPKKQRRHFQPHVDT
jgi:Ran GTPase-activating protein (RanGAP) involved in mRNA processing and transport